MALLLGFALVYGSQDLDVRIGAVAGKSWVYSAFNTWAPNLELRYRGSFPIATSFSILAAEDFAGLSEMRDAPALPGLNYPVTAVTAGGLEYTGFGLVQAQGFSQYIYKDTTIFFPVVDQTKDSLKNTHMRERMKNGAELFGDVPLWRFSLTADALYNDLTFDWLHGSVTDYNEHDADLWTNAALSFDIVSKLLQLKGAVLMKDDLNKSNDYNIKQYQGGIGGDGKFFGNSLLYEADAYARYVESPAMELQNFNDSLGSAEHFRLAFKPTPGFLVKADGGLETGTTMRKFRGELSVRNAWTNGSMVEGGFWASGGGLFPRECGYLSAGIAVTPSNVISPSIRTYWRWMLPTSDEAEPLYQCNLYRMDFGLSYRHDLGSTLPLLEHLSFLCETRYRRMWKEYVLPTNPVNASNLFFTIGLSNWL